MKAILPVLDESRKRAYYLQLYDYIKDGILNGEIMEDEKLPSLRNLSRSTGLSITTIEQAYNQLLVEGYIYSKAQSGYYVSQVFPHAQKTVPSKTGFFMPQVSPIANTIAESTSSFRYDPECFDFNKWKKCMNKMITDFPSTLFFESDPQGELVLRAEICRYLYRSRGVFCTPDQIIIGAGTQQITNHLATMLRKLSIEHVALENPGYLPVRSIFRDRGFAITSIDVASDGLMIEKLPTNIRSAVYASPSNHMFTGAVMPIGRRYELLNWAKENDSYIIEDDYDSELRYFGKPIPALKSLQDSQRVIYLGSFSSTLFAAVKISYMVLPPEMAQLFSDMAGDYSQTCSKLEQLTLALFMENGYYQTHIKKLRKLYAQKLNAVVDLLGQQPDDFIQVQNTASGINVILKIHSAKAPAALKKDAEDLGIPLTILSEPNLFLLYYNQIPLQEIPAALTALVTAWHS